MRERGIEIIVGLFVCLGIAALLFLAFKVSQFSAHFGKQAYVLMADFDDIGDLKVRAPVTMAGVRVGEVESITLDTTTYQARVKLVIAEGSLQLPTDTVASILTAGLLGAKYIGLRPGFETAYLKAGDRFQMTHSAVILENLIGQFLFNAKSKKTDNDSKSSDDKGGAQSHTSNAADDSKAAVGIDQFWLSHIS